MLFIHSLNSSPCRVRRAKFTHWAKISPNLSRHNPSFGRMKSGLHASRQIGIRAFVKTDTLFAALVRPIDYAGFLPQ
jgi:hypothetical protein